MGKYILDTNALMALSKNNKNFMQRFNKHVLRNDPILTTVLNYYEFARGLSVSINPAVSIIKKYFRNIIKIEPISYKI